MDSTKARHYEIKELLGSFLFILSLCPFLPRVTSLIFIVKKHFWWLLQTQVTTGKSADFDVTEGVSSASTQATTAPGSLVSIATFRDSESGTWCNLILSSCEKPHTDELLLTRQLSVPPTHNVYRLKLKWPICELNILVKVSILKLCRWYFIYTQTTIR